MQIRTLMLLSLLGATAACAQSGAADRDEDPMVIARKIYERGIAEWNAHARTDPASLTQDADVINAMGPHWHGRAAASGNGQQVAEKYRSQLSLEEIVSAETIAPGVILVIARGKSVIPAGRPGAGEHHLHQMSVLVKVGDDWLTRALSSTPIVGAP